MGELYLYLFYRSKTRVPCSYFVLSVGLSVGNKRVFWKNVCIDQDAVWGDGSVSPRNDVLDDSPTGRDKFMVGKWCATMGECRMWHQPCKNGSTYRAVVWDGEWGGNRVLHGFMGVRVNIDAFRHIQLNDRVCCGYEWVGLFPNCFGQLRSMIVSDCSAGRGTEASWRFKRHYDRRSQWIQPICQERISLCSIFIAGAPVHRLESRFIYRSLITLITRFPHTTSREPASHRPPVRVHDDRKDEILITGPRGLRLAACLSAPFRSFYRDLLRNDQWL